MRRMLLGAMFLLSACNGFNVLEGGTYENVPPILTDENAIIQGEINFGMVSGIQTVKQTHPFIKLLLNPAIAAEASQAVTVWTVSTTAAAGVTFTATFTPANPVVDVTTGQVKIGTVTITALDDNSVRKCGTTPGSLGNKRCDFAYIRFYTSTSGMLGSGDLPDTAPVLVGKVAATPVSIVAATAVIPYTANQDNITSNRFRLSNMASNAKVYDVYVDFTNVGDGAYSTQLTIQYAIGK